VQLKFVWERELEPHRKKHEAQRLEYEQKVREIKEELAKVEGEAREKISALTKEKKERDTEFETLSNSLHTKYQSQLDPIKRRINSAWADRCRLQASLQDLCCHVSSLTAEELLAQVPANEHCNVHFECRTCGARFEPSLISNYVREWHGEAGRSDFAYATGNPDGVDYRNRATVVGLRGATPITRPAPTGQEGEAQGGLAGAGKTARTAPAIRRRRSGGRSEEQGFPSTPIVEPPSKRAKRSFVEQLYDEPSDEDRGGPSWREDDQGSGHSRQRSPIPRSSEDEPGGPSTSKGKERGNDPRPDDHL
jgi:hypothetical protein